MHTLRVRPFMYFAMGIAVTVAAAWSLSSWQASAAVSADESTFVNVSPTRILDTREDIGLPGPFVSAVPQDLKVTGTIPTKSGTTVVVPDGATGVIFNVTVVGPTAAGFVSIRPADAPGVPTTSSLNFNAGDIIPNSVTVQMPTSGTDAGQIEITYDAFGNAGPTTEMLIDVVGYTKNAGLASLQAEVAVLQAQAHQLTTAASASTRWTPPSTRTGQSPHRLRSVNPGACSADVPTLAPGAAVGSNTMVLNSRLAVGGSNPGWIATGGATSTTPGVVNVEDL